MLGVLRAVFVNLLTAEKHKGASTITQQAARNVFLTLDKRGVESWLSSS
jgi:membrane carboxypeptidase/penicillin-binding protein